MKNNKIKLISIIIGSVFFSNVKIIYSETTQLGQPIVKIHNPIIFIHGWTKTRLDWILMISRFINDGWNSSELFAYSFPRTNDCSDNGIKSDASYIKNWVDNILNMTSATKIDIIAHSMGGISARYYIKFLGGNETVKNYINLGTDHHGTPNDQVCYQPTNSLIEMLNEGEETPGGILNDTIGLRKGPYGVSYNGTHISGAINYTSIFSKYDEIVPYNSTILMGANHVERSFEEGTNYPIAHSDLYQDLGTYNTVKLTLDPTATPTPYPTSSSSSSSLFLSLSSQESGNESKSQTSGLDLYFILFAVIISVKLRKKPKN